MKILFIVPYPPGEAPSQRFRFEQYFSILWKNGHSFKVSPFLSLSAWKILYRPGHLFAKLLALFQGYFRRILDLFSLYRFDVVFIHREASPFGPPWIEWLITRVLRKFTIYDFDDAIWIPNASDSNNKLTMSLKYFNNPAKICAWASRISVGNQYLGDFARKYNKDVVYNPTTIDTAEHHNITTEHGNAQFILGWTGSHSTLPYLDTLYPVLKELEEEYEFELHVICDVPPRWKLKSLRFIKWTKEAEITDLLNFNVGLMPLPDDVWAKGKCGFKALQYMALGIPAVVSPVGVNAEIVDHDINGCVCNSPEDWKFFLGKLMKDPDYLKRLAAHTREKIQLRYSVESNTRNFLRLFDREFQ